MEPEPFSEIKVTIRDDEKKLIKEFPTYGFYQAHIKDPVVSKCIDEVLENFDGTPDKVSVVIKLESN